MLQSCLNNANRLSGCRSILVAQKPDRPETAPNATQGGRVWRGRLIARRFPSAYPNTKPAPSAESPVDAAAVSRQPRDVLANAPVQHLLPGHKLEAEPVSIIAKRPEARLTAPASRPLTWSPRLVGRNVRPASAAMASCTSRPKPTSASGVLSRQTSSRSSQVAPPLATCRPRSR